jgi:hypothetical protein
LTHYVAKKWPVWLLSILGLAVALLIASSCTTPTPEVIEKEVTREVRVEVTREVQKEVTREVQVEITPEVPPGPEVPFEAMWAGSGHADADAEAFRHWDEDDPQEIPASCAKCHSSYGYLDFLGVDGTAVGTVDNPAAVDSVIDCVTCHNAGTVAMTSVVFPSGVEVTGLGPEARCMQCHQGRASAASVNGAIEEAGLTDDDTVSEDLGFTNIHYYAAAVSLYGDIVKGGYEYEGKAYDAKFDHVAGFDTCVGCHSSHTLELKLDACAECHTGVASREDLKDIRVLGSLMDYDGDGDMDEGIYYELEGLRDMLYQAIQAYASEVLGTSIVYDAQSYPYWFTDAEERYASWTARLAKAAYNYQTSLKDPGAYAHGGKYLIQLLYDSIEDLNVALSSPVDLSNARRIDHGHFAGSEEAFRHWDEEGEVPGSCARCHSAAGLSLYVEQGAEISQPIANGLNCATCHNDLVTFTRYEVGAVEFPSGASLDTDDPDSNLCLNCHQGRESTVSVNGRIGDAKDDTVVEGLGFVNVHYFAAGATLFGAQAQGAYEYTGKAYNGRFEHQAPFTACVDCHNTHALEVEAEACGVCHEGVESQEDLATIRISESDFDGDGDAAEGIAGEVETLHEALYDALQAYASDVVGTGIVYNAGRYPYWFTETEERYSTWTPRLLRAAYNYQYVAKDPGAFAHNGQYILQILYDSLEDLGADVSGFVRPEVRP